MRLEVVQQRAHDAGAGHAERVADGDRAALDVELVDLDAELVGARQDLRGEGADVFAKLVKQRTLTGRDVQDALLHAGIMLQDFAGEVGCNVKYLGQVLRGNKPFARKLESKIRVALGLDTDRDGDAGMAGRPCNWKSPAKARKAGAA